MTSSLKSCIFKVNSWLGSPPYFLIRSLLHYVTRNMFAPSYDNPLFYDGHLSLLNCMLRYADSGRLPLQPRSGNHQPKGAPTHAEILKAKYIAMMTDKANTKSKGK